MASKEQTQALTSHVADAHKERQAVQPNWDTLPDCLLGLILAAAGKDCWRAVTLTCKRWRRIYHLEPSLQPTFNLYFSPTTGLPACGRRGPPTQQQRQEVERRVARLASSAGLVAGLSVMGDPLRYGYEANHVLGLLPGACAPEQASGSTGLLDG
ncbi:hypothetical protein ABPG77_006275 [Micractinium sp. CCAP 211/92]